MNPPGDQTLPFFAYGIFRPGELAFLQIKPLVIRCEQRSSIPGRLLLRDGLPILDPQGSGEVEGSLIEFQPKAEVDAYMRICKMEPQQQYYWDVAAIGSRKANYLAGKSPLKGSVTLDQNSWSGCDDPFFTTALEVVEETLRDNCGFDWNLKPLFKLEMAYGLLWSAIERYASFRYYLGEKATEKIQRIGDDPIFAKELKMLSQNPSLAPRRVRVYRADKPKDFYDFSANNPKETLNFYYQIRCNSMHRGKAVVRDHELLSEAIADLLRIFRALLSAAFTESAR